MTKNECPAYAGRYQDIHDSALAKGRPCEACSPRKPARPSKAETDGLRSNAKKGN